MLFTLSSVHVRNYMLAKLHVHYAQEWLNTRVPLGDRMKHLQFLVTLSLLTTLCLTWCSWASRGFYLIEEVAIETRSCCKGRLSGSLNLNLFYWGYEWRTRTSLFFVKIAVIIAALFSISSAVSVVFVRFMHSLQLYTYNILLYMWMIRLSWNSICDNWGLPEITESSWLSLIADLLKKGECCLISEHWR